MGIVRGDRVTESQKLARVSLEAYWAFSLWVDVLPDDFGRCRLNPRLMVGQLAKRRDDLTTARVARLLAEYVREELIRTWVVDGEVFGEFVGYKPTGNRYHRTPEPPWSTHAHQGACVSAALHRAREWGSVDQAERLSLQLREFRDRKGAGTGPGRGRETPLPSLPSVPSVPSLPSPPSKSSSQESGVSGTTTTTVPPPGSRLPDACPICGRPLILGDPPDHAFCGEKRGGCGRWRGAWPIRASEPPTPGDVDAATPWVAAHGGHEHLAAEAVAWCAANARPGESERATLERWLAHVGAPPWTMAVLGVAIHRARKKAG